MAKTQKRSSSSGGGKSGGGSSSRNRTSSSGSAASGRSGGSKGGRANRASKSTRRSNGKGAARTSNGLKTTRTSNGRGTFSGITRGLKLTAIGTAGGVVTRLGSDVGISLAVYAAPTVGIIQHWAARPVLSGLLAWFGTPRIFRMIGFNPESAESARIGGLIASGFDFVDGALPGSRERLASKFSFGRGQDRRQVATNARTALPEADQQQIIDSAAQAGAQAGAAAAMAGLGMVDEGVMDTINEEDTGELSGGEEYDPDWDAGGDY